MDQGMTGGGADATPVSLSLRRIQESCMGLRLRESISIVDDGAGEVCRLVGGDPRDEALAALWVEAATLRWAARSMLDALGFDGEGCGGIPEVVNASAAILEASLKRIETKRKKHD
jgi:hypothetical protein